MAVQQLSRPVMPVGWDLGGGAREQGAVKLTFNLF